MTTTADDAAREQSPLPAGPTGISFARPPSDGTEEAARSAVLRATDHLLARQHTGGWWEENFGTDVSYDAHDLFLRHLLGVLDERVAVASGRWIRSQRSADGSWPLVFDGAGHLGTTVQAYVALRLAGHRPDEEHMLRSAARVRELGGVAAAPLEARMWLAMLGLWSWDDLPEVPPEIIALPKWAPLNIYSFGFVMRQALVSLSIISAHRFVRPVPFGIDELFATSDGTDAALRTPAPVFGWEGVFRRANTALRAYRRVTPRPVRRTATRAGARWLLERQEADGSFGACTPITTWVVIALYLQGYSTDHPVLQAAFGFLDDCASWPADGVRKLQTVHSPVWDTCLSITALRDAGLPASHPALVKAADWLLTRQTDRPGDWAVRRPRLAPGGWSFQFHNQNYPAHVDGAVRRAARWCRGDAARHRGDQVGAPVHVVRDHADVVGGPVPGKGDAGGGDRGAAQGAGRGRRHGVARRVHGLRGHRRARRPGVAALVLRPDGEGVPGGRRQAGDGRSGAGDGGDRAALAEHLVGGDRVVAR